MFRVDSSPDTIRALLSEALDRPPVQELPPQMTSSSSPRFCLSELSRRRTSQPKAQRHVWHAVFLICCSLIIGALAVRGVRDVLLFFVLLLGPFLLICIGTREFEHMQAVAQALKLDSTIAEDFGKPSTAVAPRHQKRASGTRHVLQIGDEGEVLAKGDSSLIEEGEAWIGHLGLGVEWGERVEAPTAVALPSTCAIVEVAAGDLHSLFLCGSGAIYACGFGCEGPLGLGNEGSVAIPRQIAALEMVRVESIAAGGVHSLAVCSHGTVWSWGWGRYGQLGHGDKCKQLKPRRVGALTAPVVQVAAGSAHSLVLGADGAVYSFGKAAHGQCGHGTSGEHVLLPTRVEALAHEAVREVQAEAEASSALVVGSGTVRRYAWGQLGGSEAVLLPTLSPESHATLAT